MFEQSLLIMNALEFSRAFGTRPKGVSASIDVLLKSVGKVAAEPVAVLANTVFQNKHWKPLMERYQQSAAVVRVHRPRIADIRMALDVVETLDISTLTTSVKDLCFFQNELPPSAIDSVKAKCKQHCSRAWEQMPPSIQNNSFSGSYLLVQNFVAESAICWPDDPVFERARHELGEALQANAATEKIDKLAALLGQYGPDLSSMTTEKLGAVEKEVRAAGADVRGIPAPEKHQQCFSSWLEKVSELWLVKVEQDTMAAAELLKMIVACDTWLSGGSMLAKVDMMTHTMLLVENVAQCAETITEAHCKNQQAEPCLAELMRASTEAKKLLDSKPSWGYEQLFELHKKAAQLVGDIAAKKLHHAKSLMDDDAAKVCQYLGESTWLTGLKASDDWSAIASHAAATLGKMDAEKLTVALDALGKATLERWRVTKSGALKQERYVRKAARQC